MILLKDAADILYNRGTLVTRCKCSPQNLPLYHFKILKTLLTTQPKYALCARIQLPLHTTVVKITQWSGNQNTADAVGKKGFIFIFFWGGGGYFGIEVHFLNAAESMSSHSGN